MLFVFGPIQPVNGRCSPLSASAVGVRMYVNKGGGGGGGHHYEGGAPLQGGGGAIHPWGRPCLFTHVLNSTQFEYAWRV